MKKTISLTLVLALCMVVKADFTFGEPTNLGPTVNNSANEWGPSISADGLWLFFASDRPGGHGNYDIWMTERQTSERNPEGYWIEPVNLGPTVNSSSTEYDPSISSDGLSLFFWSDRPDGYGSRDLLVSTRVTTNAPWGDPVNLGPIINSSFAEVGPDISSDGLELYFVCLDKPGGYGQYDIWMAERDTIDDYWGAPTILGPSVNSSAREGGPSISADGLSLFFFSDRPGSYGVRDIWVTRRSTKAGPWGTPVNLGPTVNNSARNLVPDTSSDGCMLFFTSDRPGGVGNFDLYQAPIIPIVDLNSDGIVDADDMCIMVYHWGTDNSLCDIGPMPWGDGVVDVEDLIVLAEHLFEELPGRPIEP